MRRIALRLNNPAWSFMPEHVVTIETVLSAIRYTGLVPRGALRLAEGELADVRTIVLIGVAGQEGWPAFAASPEAQDGADHPLDRWSRRVIDALARELNAVALYPFGGPPYRPFQQWARRAEPVHPSPIGILIHPVYGLWHSYRGALGFAEAIDVPPLKTSPSPCDSCRGRPCLSACPVGAFSVGGYDVAACAAQLKSPAGADCMTGGCLARRACPVGAEHAHAAEQAAFTMRTFLRAREAAVTRPDSSP
jgi:ferredoxin